LNLKKKNLLQGLVTNVPKGRGWGQQIIENCELKKGSALAGTRQVLNLI